MNQYYLDTSVLLVYTLASGSETARYPAVQEVFRLIKQEVIKAMTSFYALHEVYLFALEHAPDFELGTAYGKEAMTQILSTKLQLTPLLNRMERKINARLFRTLPDGSDLPHAISAKIWGCDGIIAYDDHFRAIADVLTYTTPEELLVEYEKKDDDEAPS